MGDIFQPFSAAKHREFGAKDHGPVCVGDFIDHVFLRADPDSLCRTFFKIEAGRLWYLNGNVLFDVPLDSPDLNIPAEWLEPAPPGSGVPS